MITVNMTKAKEIAHAARREKRAEDFKPLDIQATIPAQAAQAEVGRQAIRDADAGLQQNIDNTNSPEELKAHMIGGGLI